jgi:predicted 2-oxoglutarate/Fe(II)-dependent dioxygenase YbiX
MIYQQIIFTIDECNTIINLIKTDNRYWDSNDRNYKSLLILNEAHTNWIFERLKNFFEVHTGISIIEVRPELHFHIYEPTDYFGIHDDNMDYRVFSVGVLLNDNFDGGDFILYPNNKTITLDKSAGNSYIFPVSIKHEVTKIIKGERYSLIWFLKNTNIKSNSKSLI